MLKLWQAMVGEGNRKTTFMGIGALLCGLGTFFQTGELDFVTLGLGFTALVGLFARGGGTGSDTPA
jgi:hypothetical protein